MDAYSLYPPNTSGLSDHVIGNVVQRVRPHRTSYTTATEQPLDESLKATLKILLQKRDRRREVCRINQARYVNRQRKLVVDLEADVEKLQKEVKDLELQHHNMHTNNSTRNSLWTVATEYFSLFRRGVTSAEVEHTHLLRFLHESMTTDVTDGSLCGPEALLSNWRTFSLCFTDIQVEIEEMKKGEAANTLIGVTTTRVTISTSTLRRVFPHLNSDGKGGTKGGKWSPLADRLRDQRLHMRGSVRFYWDPKTERVARIETQSDLLTPVLRLLGNLKDVSRVFEHAMMTPECRLLSHADV